MKMFSPTEFARVVFSFLVGCSVFALTMDAVQGQSENESTQTSAPFAKVVGTEQPATMQATKDAELIELGDFESALSRVLSHPSARKDIGLVDDQKKRLAEIREAYQPKLDQLFRQAQEAGGRGMLNEAIATKVRRLNEEKNRAMEEELLPHQLERIGQIQNQLHLKRFGLARGLGKGKLGRNLKISDSQARALADIEDDLRKQILEKTLELKEAARKKSLEVLSRQQRDQFNRLVGDPLKETIDDWQEHFRRRKRTQ